MLVALSFIIKSEEHMIVACAGTLGVWLHIVSTWNSCGNRVRLLEKVLKVR